jgi:pimeloyl-ACP methyl ester carboxylesterase
MIAARLSAVLRGFGQQSEQQNGTQKLASALGTRKVPLEPALDAGRHEIATSDAGTISYYADTSTKGRPLVLLHGIHAAASAYEMRPLFESFRAERPVYALDLPGFGFSERGARPYKPATYVHAIEHLLRNVATHEGADVIALSLSAEYAARVAIEMPELVRSLVLISPTGFGSPHEVNGLQRRARRGDKNFAQWLSNFAPSQLLYELLVTKPSLRYFLRRSFEGRVDDGVFSYAYATSHQEGAWRAPITFVAGGLFPSGNALNAYARVRIPSLVIFDQDPYSGFGELEEFAAKHANYRTQRISHTRGLPQFDAPQQTAEALRSFFKHADHGGSRRTDGSDNGAAKVRHIGSA